MLKNTYLSSSVLQLSFKEGGIRKKGEEKMTSLPAVQMEASVGHHL